MEEIKLTIHLLEEKHAEHCGACVGDVCSCGGYCGAVSVGVDNLRQKSPEEMSVEELIEALKAANSYDDECKKILGADWCKNFGYCSTCRGRLLDLLKAAYEREVTSLEYEKSFYKEKIEAYDDDVRRRITDLTHERDGLKRRLEELSDAGITELHRLLRKTVGEAKNVTSIARHYVESARDSRKTDHEREAVIERLRGYNVYMTEPPSKNVNRLFTCITGNKDAEIACGNDIEDVRDKLIELLSYEKVPDGE